MIEHLPVPFDIASGRTWIERQRAYIDTGRGWSLAIGEVGASGAIGGIGMTFRHAPGVAELGFWVIERERNRGVAERASLLLGRWALSADTGIARLEATVEPWNTASVRVLEKVGFAREGVLRSYASWRGARKDVLLYSLIPTDLS